MYLYCGHGDGRRYLPEEQLKKLPRCPATILMGCSSGVIRPQGSFAPSGMALSYLKANCPTLVAVRARPNRARVRGHARRRGHHTS